MLQVILSRDIFISVNNFQINLNKMNINAKRPFPKNKDAMIGVEHEVLNHLQKRIIDKSLSNFDIISCNFNTHNICWSFISYFKKLNCFNCIM